MILFIYNNRVKLSDLESRLRQFVPCDQVFPFPFVYIFLYLHTNLCSFMPILFMTLMSYLLHTIPNSYFDSTTQHQQTKRNGK